ncbi:MAG: hypothetical protein EPO07_00480 [Verrucomicrobia bacterium]|nr:MAG: hypothetical protein EPO07_00480 [Verrucomicrobiota bacterium]
MSESLKPGPDADLDNFILNQVQLLLSEKRTALSTMRTGIAIFAFPLSVLSVLIATSHSYHTEEVMHWLVPLLLINAGLIGLGIYLIIIAFRRIHHYDRQIEEFKRKHSRLMELLSD